MIFLCCKCIKVKIESDQGGFDWSTFFIAIVTILITILVVYLGKRIEISTNKFSKLCLEPLEAKFNTLSSFIEENKNAGIAPYLANINEIITDLNLLLIHVKNVYPELDIDKLQDISIDFTDSVFDKQAERVGSLQTDFLNFKIRIFNALYNHALYKEVKFMSLLFRKA